MSDREATSEMSSSVREGAATTRSIHLGMNSRKVPLGPLKGNLLPIPLMRKTRTRKMRKGRGMRKMTRGMRMNGGGGGEDEEDEDEGDQSGGGEAVGSQ